MLDSETLEKVVDEINERLENLGRDGRVEFCDWNDEQCILYSEPHHLRTHERTNETPLHVNEFGVNVNAYWNELASYKFINLPTDHDYTKSRRIKNRREALNEVAQSAGWSHWSEFETAVKNSVVKLPQKPNG